MAAGKQGGLCEWRVCLLQIDLRDDPKTIAKLNDMKEKPVATEQGQKLAKEVPRSHWDHFWMTLLHSRAPKIQSSLLLSLVNCGPQSDCLDSRVHC